MWLLSLVCLGQITLSLGHSDSVLERLNSLEAALQQQGDHLAGQTAALVERLSATESVNQQLIKENASLAEQVAALLQRLSTVETTNRQLATDSAFYLRRIEALEYRLEFADAEKVNFMKSNENGRALLQAPASAVWLSLRSNNSTLAFGDLEDSALFWSAAGTLGVSENLVVMDTVTATQFVGDGTALELTNNPSIIQLKAMLGQLTPTQAPTNMPSRAPSQAPSAVPTLAPSRAPSSAPTLAPTKAPTLAPTLAPTTTPLKPLAFSVASTTYVVPGSVNYVWVAVPGLTVTFTTVQSAMVTFQASGTIRASSSTGTSACMGARFTIDGTPRGESSWGERLNCNDFSYSPWDLWRITGFAQLNAGTHTVRLDVTSWPNSNNGIVCGEVGPAVMAYSQCVMNVQVFYDSYVSSPSMPLVTGVDRTSFVSPTGTWTTIPGLTRTFTLTSTAQVQFTASGTQRSTVAGSCQIGYRFTVDGVPEGDATWGTRVIMSESSYKWWQTWRVDSSATLGPGVHTISVDARSPSNCLICAEIGPGIPGFSSCTLNTFAFYTQPVSVLMPLMLSTARTGAVSTQDVWTNVPGLSSTFTLTAGALVQFAASGTVRTSAAARCQTAFRFVVDGIGQGDSSWGNRVLNTHDSLNPWQSWSIDGFSSLPAGTHTVAMSVRLTDGGKCFLCAEQGPTITGYSMCNMNIQAFYY